MPDNPESLLVADIGSVNTKVALVDRVGGEYRFVGTGATRTTAEPPDGDVVVGVRRAMELIQARTGRRFMTDEGQLLMPERPTGQGVDAFTAITSMPLPLRVAIVGLSREVSVAAAAMAVHGTYADLVATLALDETGGRWRRTATPQNGAAVAKSGIPTQDPAVVAAEALVQAEPEVIVLVGGVDGGATTALFEIANLVASITASMDESVRPAVIFAGNRDARSQIATRVGQVASLRVVDNVHPALDRETPAALQRELDSLYIERKIGQIPGLAGLSNWTNQPIQTSARAFENVVRFLSRRYDLSVLGADMGGASTTICAAQGDKFSRLVRADLGLGYSLNKVVDAVGIGTLMDWIPFEIDQEELRARYLNSAIHPHTIPMTREDVRIQQAAARQALAVAAREGRQNGAKLDLILLTGSALAHTMDFGALALIALDALEPHGVFTLAVDTLGLAPGFGALASLNPEAAAHVIERDAFVTLGTVIAPVSANREGQIDLRVQVQPSGSGVINLEVEHGSLEVIPLAPGQKGTLQVHAAPGVDLGPAQRGVFKADVEGGTIGLIMDARGRPIALPPSGEKRREKIQQWLWDVGSA